jgi:hypothetical protein
MLHLNACPSANICENHAEELFGRDDPASCARSTAHLERTAALFERGSSTGAVKAEILIPVKSLEELNRRFLNRAA